MAKKVNETKKKAVKTEKKVNETKKKAVKAEKKVNEEKKVKEPKKEVKKSKKTPIIVCSILAVLLVAAGATVFFWLKSNYVTITFDSDGGTEVAPLKVKKKEVVTLPTSEKEGYEFEGWYLGDEKAREGVWFIESVTLKAHWLEEKAKTMTISFDSNGGNKLEAVTIECESSLNLPKPTRTGYTFAGWYDKNDVVISNETKLVCEDISLKAKWNKVEVKKPETTKPVEPAKVYTCPDGYTLNGTKCTSTKSAAMVCPSDTYAYNGKCVKIGVSYRVDPVRECGKSTVVVDNNGHTQEFKGVVAGSSSYYYYCVYGVVNSSEEQASQSVCNSRNHKWWNGTCYYGSTGPGVNISYTCSSSSYMYLTTEQVNSLKQNANINGCFQTQAKQPVCETNYTYVNGSCSRTIDATLK